MLRFDREQTPGHVVSPWGELTTIESKYCLTFFATWYASPLRVIGSWSLFQNVVEISCRCQYVTIQLGQAFLPGIDGWAGSQGT